MKKYISLLMMSVVLLSCKTEMDRAMKSADKEFILKVANEKFAKKKWSDALALYDRLPNLVAGTDDAPNVVFNSAYANYYDKNYRLAANQFKNFVISFPQDREKKKQLIFLRFVITKDLWITTWIKAIQNQQLQNYRISSTIIRILNVQKHQPDD
jgi:outer membrane protein assembly factor BamD